MGQQLEQIEMISMHFQHTKIIDNIFQCLSWLVLMIESVQTAADLIATVQGRYYLVGARHTATTLSIQSVWIYRPRLDSLMATSITSPQSPDWVDSFFSLRGLV